MSTNDNELRERIERMGLQTVGETKLWTESEEFQRFFASIEEVGSATMTVLTADSYTDEEIAAGRLPTELELQLHQNLLVAGAYLHRRWIAEQEDLGE